MFSMFTLSCKIFSLCKCNLFCLYPFPLPYQVWRGHYCQGNLGIVCTIILCTCGSTAW